MYGDGNGLYLRVDRSGATRWILRTMVQGKRRDLGLGSLSLTSLAEARVKARTGGSREREEIPWRLARAFHPFSSVGQDVG